MSVTSFTSNASVAVRLLLLKLSIVALLNSALASSSKSSGILMHFSGTDLPTMKLKRALNYATSATLLPLMKPPNPTTSVLNNLDS